MKMIKGNLRNVSPNFSSSNAIENHSSSQGTPNLIWMFELIFRSNFVKTWTPQFSLLHPENQLLILSERWCHRGNPSRDWSREEWKTRFFQIWTWSHQRGWVCRPSSPHQRWKKPRNWFSLCLPDLLHCLAPLKYSLKEKTDLSTKMGIIKINK